MAKPNLLRLDCVSSTDIAACYRLEEDTALLFWHYLNTPHQAEVRVWEQQETLHVEIQPRMEVLDESAKRLTGRRLA